MAVAIKNAYAGQPAAANTTLYTCPTNTKARVLHCSAVNDTTTAVTITFHKVPSGDSVGDAYLILNAKALGSQEAYDCPTVVGTVLDAGDIISAIASVANQVAVSLDVVEIV